VLERLAIMVPGDTITTPNVAFLDGAARLDRPIDRETVVTLPLHEARDRFERDYIQRAVAAQQGNISRAAEVLGVERSNLYRKMRAFGIVPPRRLDGEEGSA
jgi:two-component system nitrogen regulation response regulator NtrX